MTAIEKATAAVAKLAIENDKKNIDRWQDIAYTLDAETSRIARKQIGIATNHINKIGG